MLGLRAAVVNLLQFGAVIGDNTFGKIHPFSGGSL